MKNTGLIIAIIYILAIIGEVRCIYKTVTCNWEPIGKAEIIYTAASITGMGAVIGWLNIEDK